MIDFSGGRPGRRIVWGAAVGAALVAMAAILLTMSATAGAGKHRVAAEDQFLKAISVPIKLRAPGDPPGIRFDISCLPPDGNAEGAGSCDGGGTVYFRTSSGISASAPLVLDPSAQVGRYVASVPASIWAASAFTYYAVIRDNTTGRTIVVPPGGSSAPQVSFAMGGPSIDLGAHTFGSTRQASARVASAGWGGGDQQVGLEDGVDMPTGAASFDVDSSGDVYLLDEAHARMLEFPVGGSPQAIALPGLAGVKADLRVSDASGTAYVLEVSNAAASQTAAPLVHAARRSSDVARRWPTPPRHRSGSRAAQPTCPSTRRACGRRCCRQRPVAGRPDVAARAGVPGRSWSETETSSC